MSPELPDDQDLEGALRDLAARPRSPQPDDELAWRIAAGGECEDADRQQLFADPGTVSELGVASALLEVRGRPHADAQRSTDAVMRRIGLSPARSSWPPRSWIALAVAAAAAALVLGWSWWGPAPSLQWSATEVVARVIRSGARDGLQFRVRLRPAADCWPAVFVLHEARSGVSVQRLHPLRPDLAESPEFASWPKAALGGGREILLPPAAMEPFQVSTSQAFLLLVEGGDEPFGEQRLEEMARIVTASLAGVADAGSATAAVAALASTGLLAHWQLVTLP